MSLKSALISLVAPCIRAQTHRQGLRAVQDQVSWLQKLIQSATPTRFGNDHDFQNIKSPADFKNHVPLRNYESLRHYMDQVIAGEKDILWPGHPLYFAKTSGTTSGTKYIPITPASIRPHISAARNTILNYTARTDSKIFGGKMIFLSGSPELSEVAGIATGRLSGIVNHEIPSWLQGDQLPSRKTNCISDWEEKLDRIVDETHDQDLRLISGIPPWVQMYYERLLVKTGKSTIKEIFPNLSVFIHGGVNYAPYKESMATLHGGRVDTLETYPASEGFIAYQNDYKDDSLLLNTNAGLYFEFVPLEEADVEVPSRLGLVDVVMDQDYAVILSSNAGLWGYKLGDTVRFTSLNPYKIKVSGRVKHFISAFGEHVIAKEVEEAMALVTKRLGFSVTEFSVAPQVQPPEGGLPYHEWLVEFEETPDNLAQVEAALDQELIRQNTYYKDLIDGGILRTLKIKVLGKQAFRTYMKSLGKLGGQNKVPRLLNDRSLATAIGQ